MYEAPAYPAVPRLFMRNGYFGLVRSRSNETTYLGINTAQDKSLRLTISLVPATLLHIWSTLAHLASMWTLSGFLIELTKYQR